MNFDNYLSDPDEQEFAEIQDEINAWREADAILSGEIEASPETVEKVKQWLGQ